MANATTTQTQTTDGPAASMVAMARAGDEPALDQLVRTYWPEAYRVAVRILRSHEDAEEITQDALWAAITHLSTFREDAAFGTWLHRIVVNHSLMALRRKHSRVLGSSTITIDAIPNCIIDTRTPEELLLKSECRSVIEEGLSRLPDSYSVVLQLFAREGRSTNEIADRMGISIGAVKSRLHRGRAHLRRVIGRRLCVNKGLQSYRPEAESTCGIGDSAARAEPRARTGPYVPHACAFTDSSYEQSHV